MSAAENWLEANQRYLAVALGLVRAALEQHLSRPGGKPEAAGALKAAAQAMPAPSALEHLASLFGLSAFERDVLLLCAGVELDSAFAALCATAQGDVRRTSPTFSLALAALPAAHWSALSPAAPLRRWRLIELGAGEALTTSPLRIDERVLHYLTGLLHLDERLQSLLERLPAAQELPPSHRSVSYRLIEMWSRAVDASSWPVIQLCGGEQADKRAVAAAACNATGIQLYSLRASDAPASPGEREALARLWEREALLSESALLVDCEDAEGAEQLRAPLALVESLRGPVIVIAREPVPIRRRPTLRLDVNRLSAAEQQVLWQNALGPLAPQLNGQLGRLVAQFNLSAPTIYAASIEVSRDPARLEAEALEARLWNACRIQARPRLDDLAQRIEPTAIWDDLVLPELQRQTLREIAAHVRQRVRVYEHWGFASKGARGLGISALFAGPSGTGKTMAAEVLANELRLDLYHIDLSRVVSKYIGETEANLRRVFDAAETGGAILLFDEADALFGKRSEVKDSRDRYANIEVSYLLQRMEAYRGLAILTTNMKNALDTAFLRRLRFVVQFPFPDTGQRAEIWRRIFPHSTPTQSLEVERLARLNMAGGNIRNIALNAAFLAADAGEPVRMGHILRAVRSEYAKLEKGLTEAEIRDWV